MSPADNVLSPVSRVAVLVDLPLVPKEVSIVDVFAAAGAGACAFAKAGDVFTAFADLKKWRV